MGAALEVLRQAACTLEGEATYVTDNPLIFADEDQRFWWQFFTLSRSRSRRI